MKRDPNYIIGWKDWLQIIVMCVGVGVASYIAVVLIAEGTWVIPEWIQAFLK